MDILKRLKQSAFIRHNAIFFFGSVGVGVLNYLYYPVLARLLEPASFGEVQTLVSLFLQLTVFMQVLNMVVVNVVINYKNAEKANRTIFELEKLAVLIAGVLMLLSIIFGPWLKDVLQFQSSTPFIALALAILVSMPLAFRSGFVRAKHRFGATSLSQAIGAGGKIMLSAALVAAGLSTLGATLGIVAAQILALAYAGIIAAQLGFKRPEGARYTYKVDFSAIKSELSYSGAVLVTSLSVMLLMSVDMLAVKYFFPPEEAGLYAGITSVARAIFFFTTSIAFVLLPHVKLTNEPGQNRQLLLKSAGLLFLVGGSALAIFVLYPSLVIKILMGQEYTQLSSLLPWLSLAIFIISFINLLFAYFLALRVKIISLVGIMGFVAALVAIAVHHGSMREVVDSILLGSVITLGLLALFATLVSVQRKRPNNQGSK
jgi:O-antigen/teichoic acid export membrane protein